jgi:outer membrane autotransporter protein
VLQGIVGTSDPKLFADAMRIGDARNVGDARAVQTDFGKMTDAQIKDALGRLTNPIVTAADAVGGAISGAGQMTQNRIGELSQHPTAGMQTADSGISGVSAGDGDDRSRYGAWVSPFYNVANQSAKSGAPGYKATSYGTSIGADTMTNADMSLGVALSYLKTDVKHKNIKSGDKTKADTYMFSVYGIQQLTNEWFLQGVATFNSSKIKNSEKRGTSTTSTGYQTVKGEYDATSYGVEALAGYLYSTGEVKVTPLGGIAVSRFNDGGYKETGTTSQNLTITKKAMSKLEGILGARVEMANVYAAEGMELVPELHAYARHNFLNQNAKVTTKLDGQYEQSTPKTAKPNKTMFNLGASLNSKSGMYEYGAGYDLNLSNKYVGHQGTVKVRVNF